MSEKFSRVILGVNPYSYLLHQLSGIPVLGQVGHFPQYHYQTPMNHDISLLDRVSLPLELELLQTGIRFQGHVLSRWPDSEIKEKFLQKVGLDQIPDVGTSLYLSLKLQSRDWFRSVRFRKIQRRNGIYQIFLEDGGMVEAETVFSTLPLMLLAKMMKEVLSLRRFYVYRFSARFSTVELDPEGIYSFIYEYDDTPYRYVRLRDSKGKSYWMEDWIFPQEQPKEQLSGLKHFYTLPVPFVSGPLREFNGIHLFGTYAQWDYRITLADAIYRYLTDAVMV